MDYNELMDAIKAEIDPDEVIDILGLTTEELLDLDDIKLMILANKDKFSYLDRE